MVEHFASAVKALKYKSAFKVSCKHMATSFLCTLQVTLVITDITVLIIILKQVSV